MFFSHFIQYLLDAFFPRSCIQCNEAFDTWLCEECAAEVFEPQQWEVEGIFCTAAGWYAQPVLQQLIRRLKFDHLRSIAPDLAQLILRHQLVQEELRSLPRPVLIPIPLHKSRLRERGYNQALLLAKGLGDALDIPVVDALERVRSTSFQSSLGVEERQQNLNGAFRLREELSSVRGLHALDIILVDDVITSGATLLEAERALGALPRRSLQAIAVARSVSSDAD